jgi:ribosomal protein L4
MKRNNKPVKKLALKKAVIARLQNKEMNTIRGGEVKTSVNNPISCVLACLNGKASVNNPVSCVIACL